MQSTINAKIPETIRTSCKEEALFLTRLNVDPTEAALAALVMSNLSPAAQKRVKSIMTARLLCGEVQFKEHMLLLEKKMPQEAGLIAVLRILSLGFPAGYSIQTTQEQGPRMTLLLLSIIDILVSQSGSSCADAPEQEPN